MDRAKTPSSGLWIVMLLLTLVGLYFSIHLTYVHVQANLDPLHQSACTFDAKYNCDAVARSPYSVFLNVPVAVWGLLGYLMILLTLLLGMPKKSQAVHQGTLLFLTTASSLASAIMLGISLTQIKALCPFCLATYVINPLLLVCSLLFFRTSRMTAIRETLA
ncbi:MAG: vitamin K epoxide reductase family protein, partial [Myxococcota bacterium]